MSLTRNEEGYYVGEWNGRQMRLPSVTTVLGLLENYDRVDREILARACAFGTAVHSVVDLHESGMLDESTLDANLIPILSAWKLCKAERDVAIRITECVVVSTKMQYAGRLDAVGTVADVPALIEIKSRPYNSMLEPLQTAAYLEAWNEMNPDSKVKTRYFCELRLDGGYTLRQITGKEDIQYFRCVLAAYNWRQSHG